MGKMIISITNRIVQKPNNAFCDEVLSADQCAELMDGCSRVLDALGPKLRLGVDLIKIAPYTGYGPYGQYYRYDVKVVLEVPTIENFVLEWTLDTCPEKYEGNLSETFFQSAMEKIRSRLTEYQNNLQVTMNRIQHLLPDEVVAK